MNYQEFRLDQTKAIVRMDKRTGLYSATDLAAHYRTTVNGFARLNEFELLCDHLARVSGKPVESHWRTQIGGEYELRGTWVSDTMLLEVLRWLDLPAAVSIQLQLLNDHSYWFLQEFNSK